MVDMTAPSAAPGPSARLSRWRGRAPESQTLGAADGAIEIVSDGGGDEASGCSDPEIAYLRKAQARRRALHRSAGPSTANGSSRHGRGGREGGGAGGGSAAVRGVLVTLPRVCEEHLAREARLAREAMLVYEDAEVMVEVVRSEEELQAALQPSGAERKSRRARKGRAPIKVSSTTTLGDLKLRMLEALDVHPRNVVLYVRGQPAGPDELTLAQAEVFPDEEMRALVTGDHPDDDYASLFDSGTGKRREVEMGFKNTALTGQRTGTAAAAAEDGAGGSGEGGDDEVVEAAAPAPLEGVQEQEPSADDAQEAHTPSRSRQQQLEQDGHAAVANGQDADMADAAGQVDRQAGTAAS